MSAKMKLTVWFTAMVMALCMLVLGLSFGLNEMDFIDDPAGRLVKVVVHNAQHMKYEHGHFDWDEIYLYRLGVYCAVYDQDGKILAGSAREGETIDLPFQTNVVRTVELSGESYYLYDSFVNMADTDVWLRGVIAVNDHTGLIRMIVGVNITLLPLLLLIAMAGGWWIARSAFQPVERIVSAANSISDGEDLSGRIALENGPLELKQLSDAFDRMFSRLEQSFVAERQFSSDVSHELRTPITVILAECDRARRKDHTEEEFHNSLAVIEEESHRMSDLVQSLLCLTRIQHGTDRYPMKRGNLSEFTQFCCEEFVPVDEKKIHLETEIEPEIIARFNPSLMSVVIRNLLQNAYKYGKENGSVVLTLCEQEDRAVLSVTDDGIGICREDMDKVWQRFWQADSSRSMDGGCGLGLAMVREMVEFQGGTVQVNSTVGKGSTFTVSMLQ